MAFFAICAKFVVMNVLMAVCTKRRGDVCKLLIIRIITIAMIAHERMAAQTGDRRVFSLEHVASVAVIKATGWLPSAHGMTMQAVGG